MKYNVLIIDDHPSVREGIKSVLRKKQNLNVIGESGTFQDGYEQAINLSPDIILMDVSIHGFSGIELSNKILKEKPDIKIIIVSMHAKAEYIIKAIEYGVKGYILKDSDNNRILEGISAVIDGELFIDSHISNKVISKLMNKEIKSHYKTEVNDYKSLSLREQEILHLLVEGLSVNDIAKQLYISNKTVETHKASIMSKLKCTNLVGLVRYAIQIGLVD
ncbi:MAG: response regulator transcription factor [Spirochaetes bacterium]|nr:response regulator transcription factor [Spirochaetota bacterium]